MSNICRLCLSFCSENMRPLSDCDGIVYNSMSFFMHISMNPAYPRHVCITCVNKLTEFNIFYLQIKENEEILESKLNNKALDTFYEEIRNQIKEETNEHINVSKDDIDNINENDNILKEIKIEEDLHSECAFESEDDMPLLKAKETNIDAQNIKVNTECKEENNINTNNSYIFKCLTCFDTFISQNKLLNHYNDKHKAKEEEKGDKYVPVSKDDKMLYKCIKCDKTYDKVRLVNRHAKTHCDENFHCKICGRTYKTVSEIIRHGRAHDGSKLLCSFGCGFSTVYSGALKSHELRHKEDYKYKCETCGKSFQVKTWYEQHQNTHTGAKPYVCDICGMAFHMDRYLKAHCSSVHPEASSGRRYVCVRCSQPCPNMKALTRHLKEHGITSSLLCDLCGKTLSSSEQLAIHRRLHMGVKPYSCSICDKGFAKRSNLKLHQITHSGERAHACDSCGKRYSQRSTLLRHVHRHHTAERKCPKCGATFTQTELSAHQKLCSS